ncbi:hypothetical protein CJF30_00009801 [Rutstroemia sp. NJR-2017a BBW]
MTQIK